MKKIIIFTVAILLLNIGQSQTIDGTFKETPSTENIYLYYYADLMGYDNESLQIDSAQIINNRFHFDFDIVTVPKSARLLQKRRNPKTGFEEYFGEVRFFLTNDSIVIKANKSVTNAFVLNSTVNYDAIILNEMVKEVNQKISDSYKINDREAKDLPFEILNSMYFSKYRMQKMKILTNERALQYNQFIKENPFSWISLYSLTLNLSQSEGNMVTPEIVTLYNSLGNRLKQSEPGIALASRIEAKSKVRKGAIAPAFQLSDSSGVSVKLSDYRGKYVLLEFWSSGCGACRHEAPYLKKAYSKYLNKGFDILSVSLDDEKYKYSGRSAWLKAVAQDGTGLWKQVSDLKGWKSPVAVMYDIQSIPQNYLIDPTGKIISENLRGADLQDKLEDIFYKH